MKRHVLLVGILAALLLLLLYLWRGADATTRTPEATVTHAQDMLLADTRFNAPQDAGAAKTGRDSADTGSVALTTNQDDEFLQRVRRTDEEANVPVLFYGKVVDQDSNPVKDVSVDLAITEEWSQVLPEVKTKRTSFQRQTGADGRFEVSGSRGKYVLVFMLTKGGYDRLLPGAIYGAQSTSLDNPAVLTLWRTDLHEQLITSQREIKVVPDGRRYAIDLTNGAVAEGEDGDLVVWIKRPESVEFPQKFAWSCGLVAPGGGLESEANRTLPMYRAPVGDYTNAFNFYVEYNTQAREGMSLDNHFYFRLRNGLYGRVSADFWTTYHYSAPTYRKDPAFGQIRLSYALNPSGSRLLR